MCGISGIFSLNNEPIHNLEHNLYVMGHLQKHRGPDAHHIWMNAKQSLGFSHQRLTIIDTSHSADQPMQKNDLTLVFNGEIYNYIELKKQYKDYPFHTKSDTETILASYKAHGKDCVLDLRGMFAFALFDEQKNELFCARDRIGIKPFYFTVQKSVFYFASETKTLLPFIDDLEVDEEAFSEYLTFQYTLSNKTLFKGIHQLEPGHILTLKDGDLNIQRYWDIEYETDYNHTSHYFEHRLKELLDESMDLHMRSDVEIASYVSGGIDSSLIASLARHRGPSQKAFHGRFTEYPGYDESVYAKSVTDKLQDKLFIQDMTAHDFQNNIEKVIYHLDYPVAGPGSFPQYMISKQASQHVKVILGGQGGDELFGGYARYVLAYLEQCLKAAIDDTYKDGNFVVTLESILPYLGILKEYKPMMGQFWKDGLFGDLASRYFRLIDRSNDVQDEIDWHALNKERVYENYLSIFDNPKNTQKQAYFDKMTHFDFKCLLPSLLHVEDRMSMAHGLESRVPLLDHRLVEFSATIPADIKFNGGRMKHMLKKIASHDLPTELLKRRDKMGFSVPLKEWFTNDLKVYVHDVFNTSCAKTRPFIKTDAILRNLDNMKQFSRKTWGFLSLELWYRQFFDNHFVYKNLLKCDIEDVKSFGKK